MGVRQIRYQNLIKMNNEENSVEAETDKGKSSTTTNKNNKRKRHRKSEEQKQNYKDKMMKKVQEQFKIIKEKFKKLKKKKKKCKTKEDEKPWGDKLKTCQGWPARNDDNTIRIMGQNVNGLSYYHEYIEWEMALNYMDEMQVDVMCMVEPNLDLNNPGVKEEMYNRLRKIDQHAKLVVTSSPSMYNETQFKMGGTLTCTRGNWAGYVHTQEKEKLGKKSEENC